jgi:hypothetical protein
VFSLAEVVLCAIARGDWRAFRERLELGLARVAAAAAPVPAADLRAAGAAHRRRRGLLAGEQLRAWLGERGLTLEDWRDFLERQVRREETGAAGDGRLRAPDNRSAGAEDLVRVACAEACCGGVLEAAGDALLRWAAAESLAEAGAAPDRAEVAALMRAAADDPTTGIGALPRDELERLAGGVLALRVAHDALPAAIDEAAIDAWVQAHGADWEELEFDELAVAREGAAREAACCFREDGMELEAVAALAGTTVVRRRAPAGSVERDAAGALLAARPGELIGPLCGEEHWRLLVLARRTAATPALRARARDELARARIERRVAASGRRLGL